MFTLVLAVAIVLVVVLTSGGKGPSPSARAPTKPAAHHRVVLVARLARHSLPSAVSGEAVVAQRDGVLVIGGLDSSDVSTSRVLEVSSKTGRIVVAGSLSEPRHDTAGAVLGGGVVVFGGGSTSELDSVETLRPGGSGHPLGQLPTTRSDLSALTIGGRAYVLGGYDGQTPTGVVLRTLDGRRFVAVATLPVAFRYAAVTGLGQSIYTFGGELANGRDSDAIQELDTSTGRARIIGHLPRPLSHASAVTLGGHIYVLGGRTRETPTDAILSFDPSTARVGLAGRLPIRVTNAAATELGGIGYLIGGLDASGGSLTSVIEIRLVSRAG